MSAPFSEPVFPTEDIKQAAMDLSTPSPAAQSPRPSAPTYESTSENYQTQQQAQVVPQPVPQIQQTQDNAPVTAEVAELSPDKIFAVKTVVDGVETVEHLTGKEIAHRQMNARKFTQSMQQVRTIERRALEERQQLRQIQQQHAEMAAVLNDPGRLAVYMQGKFPHLQPQQPTYVQPQAPAPQAAPQYAPSQLDPGALASVGDVDLRVREVIQAQEQDLGRRLSGVEKLAIERAEAAAAEVVNTTIARLQDAHQIASFNNDIDRTIGAVLQEHDVLNAVPQINDLIRWQVTQIGPRTPDELHNAIREVGNALAETINARVQQRQTVALATRAKLTTHGVEAPVGATPQRQPIANKPFSHAGKGDWDSMKIDALNRANFGKN